MTVKPTVVGVGAAMTGGIRPAGHIPHSSRRPSVVSDEREREHRRRSIVILSLLAACAFLFVLCLCLLLALVLVGRRFSSANVTAAGADDYQRALLPEQVKFRIFGLTVAAVEPIPRSLEPSKPL